MILKTSTWQPFSNFPTNFLGSWDALFVLCLYPGTCVHASLNLKTPLHTVTNHADANMTDSHRRHSAGTCSLLFWKLFLNCWKSTKWNKGYDWPLDPQHTWNVAEHLFYCSISLVQLVLLRETASTLPLIECCFLGYRHWP